MIVYESLWDEGKMKIKIKQKSYDEVLAMPKAKHMKPMKQ